MTVLRRIDHVAVLVRSTDDALDFYHGRLGLRVHSSEVIPSPHVRLTYLDVGNAFLQLVEPLEPESELAVWLDQNGEGLHHVCFGVDDVANSAAGLSDDSQSVTLGRGRGRSSAFVKTSKSHGVRIECTEFRLADDVERTPGWICTAQPQPG
jgi:methylmalonyl-CoA/ethylmalonyl-CoA epimerase